MLLRTILVIIIAVSLSSSAEIASSSHPTFNCLAAYAKMKGIIDPVFASVDYDSSKEECVQLRHKFISDIRRDIRSKINEAEILPKYSNCIYEKLTGSEPFVNSIIKAAALEYSGSTEQSGRLNSTVDTVLDHIKSSVVDCKSEVDLANEFDTLFDAQKKSENNVTDFQEEYCVKKYLIKNNLIDTELYNVDPNQHHINISGLNCETMIKKANDDIYEQLGFVYLENSSAGNIEKVECALEKFREADYFDLMMKLTALASIDITPQQKNNERENFTRVFARISSNISTC